MKGIVFTLLMLASAAVIADDIHRVVFQINDNDPKRMNLVLNNAANVNRFYQDKGEEVEIEIVTYGPGLMMLHQAKSPVKDRILSFSQNYDNVGFRACGNTMAKMKKKTGKDVPLLPQVSVVPAGVTHLIKRQEEGWSYIRP